MIWIGLIGGTFFGYALRLYGETFGQDRCHYVDIWDRCRLHDGHNGPHKLGFGPLVRWRQ